ncbi:MAG: glycosyltransferase [Acidobacteriaceae bacterium]
MKIFVFGSSISSSYWNGAATYYRGIYRNLHALGHEITFAEPDIYGRQQHRDEDDFSFVAEVVYKDAGDLPALLNDARQFDLVVKHSGVGANDSLLEAGVLNCRGEKTQVAFWDVDAPATLARVEADVHDAFRDCIPQYDFLFTYGGGAPVLNHYKRLGARNCHAIYNALDPETHYPVASSEEFRCDLAFVGNRLPDRERRVEEMFLRAAELAPEMSFLLGGEGWEGKPLPSNVRWIGHVATGNHNVVNSSARMVLNLNRESMASVGFSPPTRVFEAAGSGACLITDRWPGIDQFFGENSEILVASSAEEIVGFLRQLDAAEAKRIGQRMRARALREHTYAQRAALVDALLQSSGEPEEAMVAQ